MNNSKLAIVFPGQGSQSLGMLSSIADEHTLIQGTYAEASEALGYDLWELVSNGPEEKLNQTQYTQPALLTAGVACYRLWQQLTEQTPAYLAGHSLGEYTAMVCADMLSLKEAVILVQQRGLYMQAAVPVGTGSMAAILGLDDDAVIRLCEEVSSEDNLVSAANFNSPGQIVVAGHVKAVESLVDAAKEAGAKRALVLPVSVPSHCALMQPAVDQLSNEFDKITLNDATTPIVQNVDASMNTASVDVKANILRQLSEPVRWVECVQAMQAQGVDTVLECGPGKVLSGLVRRIDKSLACHHMHDLTSLQKAQEALNN